MLLSPTTQHRGEHGDVVPHFGVTPHQLEGRQAFQAGIISEGNTRVTMVSAAHSKTSQAADPEHVAFATEMLPAWIRAERGGLRKGWFVRMAL